MVMGPDQVSEVFDRSADTIKEIRKHLQKEPQKLLKDMPMIMQTFQQLRQIAEVETIKASLQNADLAKRDRVESALDNLFKQIKAAREEGGPLVGNFLENPQIKDVTSRLEKIKKELGKKAKSVDAKEEGEL